MDQEQETAVETHKHYEGILETTRYQSAETLGLHLR